MSHGLVRPAVLWALGVHFLVALTVLAGYAMHHTGPALQVPAMVVVVLCVLGAHFLVTLGILVGRCVVYYYIDPSPHRGTEGTAEQAGRHPGTAAP